MTDSLPRRARRFFVMLHLFLVVFDNGYIGCLGCLFCMGLLFMV